MVNYFKKESINDKRLSPYGDVDMDGSPNKFDCDPRDVSKDGLLGRALGIVSSGKLGQTAEQFTKERKVKQTNKQQKKIIKLREKGVKQKIASREKIARLKEKQKLTKEQKKIILQLKKKDLKQKLTQRKKQGTPLQRFGKQLARQQKPKRKQTLSAGEIKEFRSFGIEPLGVGSFDNKHEQNLRGMNAEVDLYEKTLRDGEVPRDFFLRRRAIKEKKRRLEQEFARRNNILARQHQMPADDLRILSVNPENNILRSQNIMKKREDSINILAPRNSILNTRDSGNNLKF